VLLIGMLGLSVAREINIRWGVFAAFLLSSMPLLTYHGIEAYADLALSYYAFSAVICFWWYLKGRGVVYVAVCSAFLGFSVLTKNEGLLFFFALVVALGLFLIWGKRQEWRQVTVLFSVPFLVLVLPWFAFKIHYGLGFGHGGMHSSLTWLSDPKYGADVPRAVHWEIIPLALKGWLLSVNHGLIFPLWIMVTVCSLRAVWQTSIRYLFIIASLVMAQFVFVYLTLEVTAVMEGSGIHRNTLTYTPLMVFIGVLLLRYRLRGGKG